MFAGLFNEDDIMLGNFDEDGSFIGDYTQNSQVESQAVQQGYHCRRLRYRCFSDARAAERPRNGR